MSTKTEKPEETRMNTIYGLMGTSKSDLSLVRNRGEALHRKVVR